MRKILFSILILFLFTKLSFSQVNLNSGLVAYYPFNGNTNDGNFTNDTAGIIVNNYSLQNITASFTAPDTVCINSPVNIQNTSQGATNYYWSFCTANINQPPIGTNLGNVGGLLTAPVYIDYVFTNGNYYGFVTNNNPGGLLRLDFGNSLLNTPVVTNLGNIGGVIPNNTEGVQIANDNGNWYVLIVGGDATAGSTPSLTTVSLGTNIANNTPTATNWGNIGNLSYPHDLYVFNDNGHWYGLTVNYSNNTITLFDLTTSLSNTPLAINLGNIGNLNGPTGIQAINDNGNWRVFVTNATSSTLTRLDFGSSLLNVPTGVNLGNPNNAFVTCWDIHILKYCGENEAFVINANGTYDIVKLDFGNSLLNIPTAVSLGNQGNLNFPHCISKLFRVGADVFSFITNVNNNTLTLLEFPGCANASIPNSTSQNPPAITYNTPGTYNINLTVDDGLPTQSSYCKQVVVQNCCNASFDFSYEQDVCNPLSVKFSNIGTGSMNPYWSFGDGNTITGTLNPTHTYASPGNYVVKFSVQNGGCIDTVSKTISLAIIPADIIITPDTTICAGNTKQLRTVPSLSFCWSPATYLNDPLSPNPVTSTPQNITYYFTAEVTGNNIITNGNFSSGNTGFTSQYSYANPNVTEGQYFVGASPQAWNSSLSNCSDHTTGNGNMLLVNGAPTPDINVWKETITVTPNTNYAFSTWIQALYPPNPAQLQFSINGITLGNLITASLPPCTWTQFYTTWNSGNLTSATISIVNKNTQVQGNDFALDDISFAPVFIKRDSVKITVNIPFIRSVNDSTVCAGSQIQMNTTGATNYTWTPVTGLSNSSIASPVATLNSTITYFVSGINNFGCTAKDTVKITALPAPIVNKSSDTTICKNSSVQIFAGGGNMYSWLPASSLNNANISNPIASPASTTKYVVTITNNSACSNSDSVLIIIKPGAVFSVSPNSSVCIQSDMQLLASGGTSYAWSPALYLSNANINNPVATPDASVTYTVTIHDSTCNETGVLTTVLTTLPPPDVSAYKSGDITCSLSSSQLTAAGAQSYTWTPATTLNNPLLSNPVASPADNTIYIVVGTSIDGCSNSDTVTVKVDFNTKSLYLLPNAFTPNGDGLNDCFGMKSWRLIELDFSIYNRWGERVFHTTDPAKCWDGTYKGRSQSSDVFVYTLIAKTNCDTINTKGYFILLK
jgi:gliding motility-associated-like protein